MAKLGVVLEPELEKRFRERAFELDISHQDALVQAIKMWMGQRLTRPELPEDMDRNEALLCAEMLEFYRSSDEMKKFIPHSIKMLRLLQKD